MTATSLAECYEVKALACQDGADHFIGRVQVKAFNNNRVHFAWSNFIEALCATHVVYDFAGTARAHIDLPALSRPYAVWLHSLEAWEHAPRKYLRALSGASLVIANSNYTLARARKNLNEEIDIRVCPLGTAADDAPAKIGPSAGPPTVLLLGRADEVFAKGHDVLIEVWPRIVSAVPHARLLLVGGGNALGRLQAMAANSPAGESIEIAGFIPDRMIEAYWQRATVFAMLGHTEGFGLTYVEAMRHGLPVIASTDDAGQEINIDGVTGFNVARIDTKKLAEVLVMLLGDRDRAHVLGSAGYRRWREFYCFSSFKSRLKATMSNFLSA